MPCQLKTWFLLAAMSVLISQTHATKSTNCNVEGSYYCKNTTLFGGGSCCWDPLGGGFCDECPPTVEPTDSPTKSPALVPTPAPVVRGDPVPIGDHCYCSWVYGPEDETDTMSPTAAPTTAPSHKKDNGGGSHYGDCDCDKDYGLVELRLQWLEQSSGVVTSMQWYHDSGMTDPICLFTDVTYGEELTCNVQDYAAHANGDFDTNTYFEVEHSTLGTCVGKFHTSCSSDIVSTYAEHVSGGDHCSMVYCTGWKDGNPSDNNDCDDGYNPCLCDNQTSTTPPETFTTTEPESTPIGDFCYCEDDNCVVSNTDHCGDCDCDKSYGLVELRMRWYGDTVDTLEFYYEDDYSLDPICEFTDLQYGEEFTCNIWDYKDSSGNIVYHDFDKNTYFFAYRANPLDYCYGSYHTSCSQDIVGTYTNIESSTFGTDLCEKVFCTGWKDGNPNDGNDCDDGLYPCTCTTTPRPTTPRPTTNEPTTSEPTTSEPTTAEPTTAEPTTPKPTLPNPTSPPIKCEDVWWETCQTAVYEDCCLVDGVCSSQCDGRTPRTTEAKVVSTEGKPVTSARASSTSSSITTSSSSSSSSSSVNIETLPTEEKDISDDDDDDSQVVKNVAVGKTVSVYLLLLLVANCATLFY